MLPRWFIGNFEFDKNLSQARTKNEIGEGRKVYLIVISTGNSLCDVKGYNEAEIEFMFLSLAYEESFTALLNKKLGCEYLFRFSVG